MDMKVIYSLPILITNLLVSIFNYAAFSQVTSDNTTNTTVTSSGNNFNILNGIQKGNNLFHSFKEFSIPTGSSATFQNSSAIKNIINRVTGGNISNIDGLIKASGNANLFLINPSGIVFGENARLDIGGSFFATTADSIVFPDNMEFSATNTDEPPLLSINVPLGIQFGSTAATITNRSQIIDSDTTSTVGLQVKPGKSISLLGGNIEFDSGRLTASGGRVNLGAVVPDSFVSLSSGDFGWILGYEGVNNFGDITLVGNHSFDNKNIHINTSGDRGGDIDIQGREILLFGAAIEAITLGSEDGGKLTINSSESLKFDGIPAEFTASGIVGGKTNLLDTRTFGSGKGADIEINSPSVHIGGQSSIGSSGSDFGFISSTNKILNQGNGGNITIRTDKFVNEDGTVQTISQGDGNSGSITLIAKEAVLDGSKSIFRPRMASLNRESGLAGDITVIAERLSVKNGTISSSGFGAKGGNININLRNLELTNTGVISTSIFPSINNLQSQESAGNITINASESISISGHRFFSKPKRLFSSGLVSQSFTEDIPNAIVGDAGIIKVTTPHLKIFDGGQIAVNTFSPGNGGDILIDADRIEISDSVIDDFGQRAGIKTTVEQGASGNGGHIDIKTNHLRVFDGGSIASDNVGIGGDAGNVSINAGIIDIDGVLSEQQLPSTISAFSNNNFSAGSVNITTDKINIRDRAEINVSNQGSGDSGNLNITASNLFIDNNGSLKADVNGGEKGNINLNIDELTLLRRGSFIETNATGTSEGGNITINSPIIAGFENSDIIANAVEGNGGNIDITTSGIFGLKSRDELTLESDISASSEFGVNGTVNINNVNIDPSSGLVELPTELKDSSQKISQGCSSSSGNSFVATGRGGIPQNPNQSLNSHYSWSDIRDLSTLSKNNNIDIDEISETPKKPAIVEATGFIRNKNGVIELVASENKPFTTGEVPDCSGKNT